MDILSVNDPRPGEFPRSWYAATATSLAPFETLKGDQRADVCVVGGGFTGLSAALHLAQKGFQVTLLEAHRVGFGASGRNGGQVGTGQRLDQDALEKIAGKEDARRLWDMSLEAVELVKNLSQAHDIPSDFRAGVLHADHRERFVRHSREYVDKLRQEYDYDQIRALDRSETMDLVGSENYHGGTLNMGGGHIHPLNFALGLARAAAKAGVRIFEKSRVTEIVEGDPVIVKTDHGSVRADQLVLATNGYLGNLAPKVARRVMPINNYILATEPLDGPLADGLIKNDLAVADSRFVVNYYRMTQDRRLLFGGGESYAYKFPNDIEGLVRRKMREIYPQLADVGVDYAWGGTLAITMSRLPNFARLHGNILSAGGYSGHGVANATLAGKVMAEAIAGQASRFDLMAGLPTPRFPGGTLLLWPLLALAMTWYSLRDRL